MTVGRPKLRWLGGVAEELRKLGIEKWWIVTKESHGRKFHDKPRLIMTIKMMMNLIL